MSQSVVRHHLYGLMAEFERPEPLLLAARAARNAGYRNMDAYTPFPVHGLHDAVGFHKTRLPLLVLTGGLTGCFLGFMMQYFASVWDYPWNIGGRPLNSWVSFIVITFECTVLCAGLTAVFAMLALNGLPRPHHPVFNVPSFELASRSHFFLCIEARDPSFDLEKTRAFMETLSPKMIWEVPDVVEPTE